MSGGDCGAAQLCRLLYSHEEAGRRERGGRGGALHDAARAEAALEHAQRPRRVRSGRSSGGEGVGGVGGVGGRVDGAGEADGA